MSSVEVKWCPRKAAKLLKQLVNRQCAEDSKWYKEADEEESPNLFDVIKAIEILEAAQDEGPVIVVGDFDWGAGRRKRREG